MTRLVISRFTPLDQLPEMLTIPECAAWLGTGRGLAYDLCRRGDLATVRFGRLLRVPRSALAAMVRQERTVAS